MCRKVTLIVSLVVVLCLVGQALADDIDWVGGSSAESWCAAANWSGGAEPNESDRAMIGSEPAGVAIPIACDANVGDIHGPEPGAGTTTNLNITGGSLIVHNYWELSRDHTGETSINISGSSIVRLMGDVRGHDQGTTTVNISGDPNIYIQGRLKGGDQNGGPSEFNFTMSGGYFNARAIDLDEGDVADLEITGGTVILREEGLAIPWGSFTLSGGAYVEMGGTFACPGNGGAPSGSEVHLNSGMMICNNFDPANNNWELWIQPGATMKIKNAGDGSSRVEQINQYILDNLIHGDPEVIDDGEYTVVGFDLDQVKASGPSPLSGTSGICPTGITLTWSAGEKAERHEVFFGTSYADVNSMTTPTALRALGNESYDTGWLEYGITGNKNYYWRIDEVNDSDPCTWKGAVWNFSTPSGKAIDPSPVNGRRGIRPGPVYLRWTPPCYLTAQTLYYGTDPCSGTWTPVALGASDDEYQLPSDSSPSEHYYWRVDTTAGALGVITGDTWDFTTGIGGRLLHLKFENNLTDSSGNDYHFTNDTSGGASAIAYTYDASAPKPAIYGNSADFVPDTRLYRDDTGDDDLLRLNGSEYTVEMWVMPRNLMTIMPNENDKTYLISKHSDVGGSDWGLRIYNNNGDSHEFRWDAGSPDNDSTEVLEDEWQHIAIVYYEGDEDLSGWYVNGEKGDNGGGGIQPDNNSPVWIGVEQEAGGSFGQHFDALMDEVRIHDIAVGPCGLLHISRDLEYPLCPTPTNGVQDVDPNGVVLTWLPGESATSHVVYFSTEEADVQNLDGAAYLDTYTYPISDLPDLDLETTYYWRVVEQPGGQEGEVWKFTTPFLVDDEDLRLHYKLDELSGDTAFDSSGYGNHGDVEDDDGWDPGGGQFGGSFGFNDDNRIDAPEFATSSISPSISISCWLKDSSKQTGDNFVFGVGNGEYEIRAAVPMADGRTIEWRAGNDSNDVLLWDMFRDNTDPRTLEDWHHWVFVKDETAGEIQIYFDGELAEANDVVDTTLIRLRESELSIGAASGNPDDLVGSVDDFRLYDIALDAAAVTLLFRGGELELAWSPDPRSGATDVDPNVVLRWRPGDSAVEHDVYIGNTKSDVADANTSTVGIYIDSVPNSPDNNYPLPASLPLGSIRYWRIDEVNGPNTWKGRVWSFTVAEFIIIDTFEQYDNSGNRVYNTWCDQRCQEYEETGSWLTLANVSSSFPVNTGSQSVEYWYNCNDLYAVYDYAEAWLPMASVGFTDWTSVDVRLLSLFFHGDASNPATPPLEQMYVGVKDTDGLYGEVRYGDHLGEALTDIQVEEWQRWDIPFVWFTDNNSPAPNDVNFASVESVHIGFGDRRNPVAGGEGYVYFDDIRLSKPVCRPEYGPIGDLDDDCFVGVGDIGVIGEQWLLGDVNVNPVVNPGDANLVGHWELDEGTGTFAEDSSANNYHGTLEDTDAGGYSWVTGRIGPNAVDFGGGRMNVDDGGATPNLRPANQVSACAWVYLDGGQESARVVVKGDNDHESYELEIDGDEILVFQFRDGNHDNHQRYQAAGAVWPYEWIHIAGTYDGSAVACYVNGQLEEENAVSNPYGLSQDPNGGFAIGNKPKSDANDTPFDGAIDDVRIYNRALIGDEVEYLASDGDGILEMEESEANLFVDDPDPEVINFKDFAKLFDNWGVEILWPPNPAP